MQSSIDDLDAFGGDPVVSAEIGGNPQRDEKDYEPEEAFPTLNTCRQVFRHLLKMTNLPLMKVPYKITLRML